MATVPPTSTEAITIENLTATVIARANAPISCATITWRPLMISFVESVVGKRMKSSAMVALTSMTRVKPTFTPKTLKP